MRKLSLLIAIIVVLAGLTANAQKSGSGTNPPTPQYPDIVVEDEGGAGFIIFNPSTGGYKCVMCEYGGYSFAGTGVVKIDGCNVYLTDLKDGYRVLISVNICSQEGKSAMEITNMPGGAIADMTFPIEEYWKDGNLLDNLRDCKVAQPKSLPLAPPTPEFGTVIIQNDADGSFLLIQIETGDYKFYHCEDGMAMTGTGLVKIDGCNMYFEDLKVDRRVLASINICDMQAKAAIEVFALTRKKKTGAPTMQEFITDVNLNDNTTVCGPKK